MVERRFIAHPHEVQAIRDDRQTQFRRIVKNNHDEDGNDWSPKYWKNYAINHPERYKQSRLINASPIGEEWLYFNDDGGYTTGLACPYGQPGTRLWLREITLEIVSVRIERVQEITEEDAIAEGLKLLQGGIRAEYAVRWDSVNPDGCGWFSNPWVWVVEFKRVEKKLEEPTLQSQDEG